MAIIEAIVLYSIDYKETGKIVYLYTENGHRSAQVYGLKKMNNKNKYLIQNGTLLEVSLGSKGLPTLKESQLINDYQNIKTDILKYSYMNHILELVRNTISDDHDHKKMFEFLKKLFLQMNLSDDSEFFSFIFELKLLYFLGYGLNFKQCSVCDENTELVFHISSGGLICKSHLTFHQEYYESKIYLIIKYLYYIDIEQHDLIELNSNERRTIRIILDQLYDEFISFRTKSRQIIKQIQKY